MKDEDKAALTLVVVLVFAVTVAWAFSPRSPFCTADAFINARDHQQVTWCFEFWLYRYQTLVSASVALLAAIIAWKNSSKALEIARRQAAAGALAHILARRSLLNDAVDATKSSEDAIADLEFASVHGLLVYNLDEIMGWWFTRDVYVAKLTGAIHSFGADIAELQSRRTILNDITNRPACLEATRLVIRDQDIRISRVLSVAGELSDTLQGLLNIASNPSNIRLSNDDHPPTGVSREERAKAIARMMIGTAIQQNGALEMLVLNRSGIDNVRKLETERAPIALLIERTVAQIEGRRL